MSLTAIIMMIVSMIVVWGGMVWAAFHLRANPDESSGELSEFGEPAPPRENDPVN